MFRRILRTSVGFAIVRSFILIQKSEHYSSGRVWYWFPFEVIAVRVRLRTRTSTNRTAFFFFVV